MRTVQLTLAAALLGIAAAVPAQTVSPAQTTPAPAPAPGKEDAQNTAPVAAANQDAAAQAAARQGAIAEVNADTQAQYALDMAAYRDALVTRHHQIVSDARLYDRQQRAYADAMAAWRHQVRACSHGHNAACKAPTPDPADFW